MFCPDWSDLMKDRRVGSGSLGESMMEKKIMVEEMMMMEIAMMTRSL